MDVTAVRQSLIDAHADCFGWALSCCLGDRELAEDVLQSVYVSVLEGSARFGGKSTFRTWLFAVIRNTARRERRGRWWSRVTSLDFDSFSRESTLTASAAAAEEADLVRAAMHTLPERQREVAHLVFYQGLTVDAAAEVLGVTSGAVRQHYARAKQTLRTRLERLNPSWSQT